MQCENGEGSVWNPAEGKLYGGDLNGDCLKAGPCANDSKGKTGGSQYPQAVAWEVAIFLPYSLLHHNVR